MRFKQYVSLAALAVLGLSARSAWAATHPLQSEDRLQVVQQNSQGLDLALSFGQLESFEVATPRGSYTELQLGGCTHTQAVGAPKLPLLRRIIQVPLGAQPQVWLTEGEAETFQLSELGINSPLLPAQASVSKSQDPAALPFVVDEASYLRSTLSASPELRVEELGILRGARLFAVEVMPVQWDPANGLLRVHNDLQLHVSFPGADWAATRELQARTRSPYFESIYSGQILNYEAAADRDMITEYPIKYVIVAHPMFTAQLQPFIEWKRQKGFEVIVGYIGDANVGSTTASIKTWLQGLYNAGTPASPAPSFILYVGDDNLVPAWTGGAGSHVTDLNYALYTAGDYIPEVLYGRFSARDTSQLQPQIDKTLEYEKYLMPDPSYLGRCVMIAGADATYGPTHGNGQINYGTIQYFNAAHGITSDTYLYPASANSDAQVIANASAGRGYINYTAHGSQTSWADPSFGITDVNGLANNHKYGTVVGNCCLTNSFQVETCFGEAWLRAANKGAIGYIGGSNNTYWNEDYWWGVGAGPIVAAGPTYEQTGLGAYDGVFHDHGEAFAEWHTTQGAMNLCGNLAVVEGGSSMTQYYWEIYHLMGDPSLSTWMSVPTANAVTLPNAIFLGQTSVTLSAQPYSYVGLSMDGVLAASGLVPASGTLVLTLAPFTTAGDADLVITHQQRQPLITTIPVVPNSGPYVTLAAYSPTTGVQGSTVAVNATLENIGTLAAAGVTGTLSLTHPQVTLTDASQNFGTIAAGATATQNGAFAFNLAAGIADQTPLHFTLTVSGTAADTWISYLDVTAQAPALASGNLVLDDAAGNNNGRLDPGETVWLRYPILNNGHAACAAGTASLSTGSPYITVLTGSEALAAIPAGGSATADFQLLVAADAPIGTVASFNLAHTAGAYSVALNAGFSIGLVVEDFETGNLARFNWEAGGTAGWSVVTAPHTGSYAAKSGTITHNQESQLNLTANVLSGGTLSFWYKVSSEASYDYLRFKVDGTELASWAGTVDWTQASYTITPGNHTFSWVYSKDGSVDTGSDCAWLDDIILPSIAAPAMPSLVLAPAAVSTVVEPGGIGTEYLSLLNQGQANLTWSATLTTVGRQSSLPFLKLGKDEADPRTGSMDRAAGGPDTFGYSWKDSNEAGGPVYSWVDISGTGTNTGTGDDSNTGPYNLGFTFNYYGTDYTAVRVCTNGWLSFTTTTTAYTNQGLPNTAEPNNLLAVFWDDLNVTTAGMLKYYADTANGRFIVQWTAVPRYSNAAALETFQVILYADGRIVYQYQTVSDVASVSVGMENATGTDGLQVVADAAYLTNNLAIEFSAQTPWVVMYPLSGTVTPGGQTQLTADFNALELSEGLYEATLTLTSNDPDHATVVVPVSMLVGSLALATPVIQMSSPTACTTQITWPAVPNATAYKIWESNGLDQPWTLLATTPYTFYDLSCIVTGTAKLYRVSAVN
ncbi:MAG: C25 family cysteine peptidase [Candidatus Delongbacteria bacterium]